MTISEAVKEVQKRYEGLGWPSLFARLKFSAAPFVKITPLIPEEGDIIDLGCGYGILANMLGILSAKRRIMGVDLDAAKIKVADRGIGNVSFRRADIRKDIIPEVDCIVVVHVLHHLPSFKEQNEVLRACAVHLRPGGLLVITEVDDRPRWKYALSWIADHILYPRDTITFRPQAGWVSLLETSGLIVRVISMHEGALFPHVTFVARKR